MTRSGWDEELQWRRDRTIDWMMARDIDCLIAYSNRSAVTSYWTGYAPRASVTNASLVVLTAAGEGIHITRLPIHVATAEMAPSSIEQRCAAPASDAVATPGDMADMALGWLRKRGLAPANLEDHGAERLAFVSYPPDAGILPALTDVLGSRPPDVSRDVAELIAVRSPWQLQRIREAAAIAQLSFTAGVDAVAAGRRPREVSLAAEAVLRDHELERWVCFVGATDSAGRSLLGPDGRALKAGDMLMFEVIPEVEGFCPEVVCNVFVEHPGTASGEVDVHMRVCLERALRNTGPSLTFAQLHANMTADLVAHESVEREFIYRLGHGTGLDNIELPEYVDATDGHQIGDGRVLSIHPNAAVPGLGTLLRGGTVIVRESRCEPLFEFPDRALVAG